MSSKQGVSDIVGGVVMIVGLIAMFIEFIVAESAIGKIIAIVPGALIAAFGEKIAKL